MSNHKERTLRQDFAALVHNEALYACGEERFMDKNMDKNIDADYVKEVIQELQAIIKKYK